MHLHPCRYTYPLLFCTPVANHTDLYRLVEAIADALEAHTPGSSDAATARCHHEEILDVSLIRNLLLDPSDLEFTLILQSEK